MLIRKRTLVGLEKILTMAGIMLFMTGLPFIVNFGFPKKALTLIRYSILLPGFLAFIQQPRSILLKSLLRGIWAWALTGLLSVSFLWAVMPPLAFQGIRSETIPMAIFSFYFAIRYTLKDQLKLLIISFNIMAAVSFFVAMFMPALGTHLYGDYAGAWKGIFVHKNIFGICVTLGISLNFIVAYYGISKHQKSVWQWLSVLIYAALILVSGSASAFIYSIAIVAFLILYPKFFWRGKRTFILVQIAFFLTLGVAAVVTVVWVPLLSALGRDPTLSARTLIWSFVIEYKISLKPILGYGRGVFWRNGALFAGIYHAAHHVPPHAHNGFVDMALDVGLIGLGLFIIGFVVVYQRALRAAYKAHTAEAMYPLTSLTVIILYNITESYLSRGDNWLWCLYLILSSSNLASALSSPPQPKTPQPALPYSPGQFVGSTPWNSPLHYKDVEEDPYNFARMRARPP
jgi:O-antigen ligase